MKSPLLELLAPVKLPPTLFSDNLSATFISGNPVFHSCMKHLAIDYHFVRDLVQWFELRVVHVSACDQLTNALTKSLSRPCLFYLCNKIGVISSTPSYLGFLLLTRCFLFDLVLIYIYIYTSTLSIIIKPLS